MIQQIPKIEIPEDVELEKLTKKELKDLTDDIYCAVDILRGYAVAVARIMRDK